ncbi:dienelactone hydrolase family protein [Fulvivirga sp. M361]|uniref:dienelactone hydrolase family protein n=1 Tax=Fulvivirga sp. M361 TaxID=2594266 RepID=UPI001179B380|nr:dienelactone hydrolase family protein [Fulvivirga sp. M361]TRX51762.1 dienelactone hydrolase family protein [Fulvivirga sp. M361]
MCKECVLQWKFLLLLLGIVSCTGKSGDTVDNKETPVEEEVVEANITGEEITYATDSLVMKGYIAYDKNLEGKRPGVLVVHEWWGHNDYARKRAEMLAELGYVALAVDMYGEGQKASHPTDAGKFAMSVMTNIDAGQARFARALEELKANPNVDTEKIGAIGYCFGGSVVLTMANMGLEMDAVAAFHSGVELPVMPEGEKVKAKILVCNGADDTFVSPESVKSYKTAMDAAGADYKYIAYEGAVHSFTSPDADSLGRQFDMPLAYNAEADTQSWNEMKALFDSVFQ